MRYPNLEMQGKGAVLNYKPRETLPSIVDTTSRFNFSVSKSIKIDETPSVKFPKELLAKNTEQFFGTMQASFMHPTRGFMQKTRDKLE